MDWIEVTIYTTSAGIEPVIGRLYRIGAAGVQIEDETEFREFLEENRRSWDYVDEELVRKMAGETRVKLYLPAGPEGREMLLSVKETLRELKSLDAAGEFGRLAVELQDRSEEDWANNWKQYFKPIEVGEKILIQPEWEPDRPADGRTVFRIDPGMAFGTGAHETTRLCIEAMEKQLNPGAQVLDLGCGSGILSIISLLLGAGHATAVDIDPNAAEIAAVNARRNGVAEHYTAFAGDILTDEPVRERLHRRKYDVVLANIVADVILALLPAVPSLLAEDGVFICSGIIGPRAQEVREALARHHFEILRTGEERDWVCMTCRLAR